MNDEVFDQIIAQIEQLRGVYIEARKMLETSSPDKSSVTLAFLSAQASVTAAELGFLLEYVEPLRAEAGAEEEAEPEKPWLDARPGEVWKVTISGETRLAGVDVDGDFMSYFDGYWGQATNTHSSTITAGHRVLEATPTGPDADEVER